MARLPRPCGSFSAGMQSDDAASWTAGNSSSGTRLCGKFCTHHLRSRRKGKRCMKDLDSRLSHLTFQKADLSAWHPCTQAKAGFLERLRSRLPVIHHSSQVRLLSHLNGLPAHCISRASPHPMKASDTAGRVRVRSSCVGINSRSGPSVRASRGSPDFFRSARRICNRIPDALHVFGIA